MPLSSGVTSLATRIAQEIKSLRSADASKADAARSIIAGTGLTGGGTLAADRSLAVVYGTAASTATQGNDTRVTYDAPATLTLSSAKFAHFSTSGSPGYQPLRVWRQGRTAYLSGFIKNTVDLGFGGHIIVADGGIPSALRPKATPYPGGNVTSISNPGDRLPRIDVNAAGGIQTAVGLYTITANANWPINMSWPLD